MLYLFLVLIVLFFLSDIFFRKTFHLLYGKPIPRNANTKEVREFMMSMMDEAEKQISYEENFEVVVKLSNYILPIMLIGYFNHWDCLPDGYPLGFECCIHHLYLYPYFTIQDYQTLL